MWQPCHRTHPHQLSHANSILSHRDLHLPLYPLILFFKTDITSSGVSQPTRMSW